LNEFPGHNGLHKFKDWWTKVQSGKDKDEESQSKFRKQFVRLFLLFHLFQYLKNDN
jgi:DNA excision repair protein ERCC-5